VGMFVGRTRFMVRKGLGRGPLILGCIAILLCRSR